MQVTRVCFVGTRAEHFEETVRLFRDVLGMRHGSRIPVGRASGSPQVSGTSSKCSAMPTTTSAAELVEVARDP
jgi:hypothetical protein